MSAEIIRLPAPRRRREDLAAQMAALFPELPEHIQRAYVVLARPVLYECADDEDDAEKGGA